MYMYTYIYAWGSFGPVTRNWKVDVSDTGTHGPSLREAEKVAGPAPVTWPVRFKKDAAQGAEFCGFPGCWVVQMKPGYGPLVVNVSIYQGAPWGYRFF